MKFRSRTSAIVLTLGMAATPILPLVAQPVPMQDRDQHNDRDEHNDQNRRNDRDRGDHRQGNDQWANNKYYKMGMKDADNDRKHNRHGRHNRKFKNDDDRRAYEAGYGGQHERGPQ